MRHLLLLPALLLPAPAFAGSIVTKQYSHDRPAVNSGSGWSTGGQTTQAGWTKSSDPIVGEVAPGIYVDKRTGRRLEGKELVEAQEREKHYDDVRDVVLYDAEKTDHVALAEVTKGNNLGEVSAAVGKASYKGKATIGARSVQVEGSARVSVVEVNAKTGAKGKFAGGDFGVEAEVDAFLGAELEGKAAAAITKKGFQANAGIEALLGAKAECTITPSVMYCGVELKAVGTGTASYGVGGAAKAYAAFNWAEWKCKFGGKLGLTAGLGLGADGDVEIKLEELVKNPLVNAECFWDLQQKINGKMQELMAKAVLEVKDALADRAKDTLADFIDYFGQPRRIPGLAADVGGWNESRRAKTRPGAAIRTSSEPTRSAGTNRGGRALSR